MSAPIADGVMAATHKLVQQAMTGQWQEVPKTIQERRDLLASGWTPLGLGERILRLETAAVVGAALLLLSPSGIRNPKSEIQN